MEGGAQVPGRPLGVSLATTDSELRMRVTAMLSSSGTLETSEDLSSLSAGHAAKLRLLDIRLATIADLSAAIRTLRAKRPDVAVLLVTDTGSHRLQAIAALVRAGCDAPLLIDGSHADRHLKTHLLERLRFQLPVPLAHQAVSGLRHPQLEIVSWCFRNGYLALSAETISRAFYVDRKTIYRILRDGKLPGPLQTVSAARLFWIAQRLQPGSAMSTVAHDLHFPSESALRVFVRRHFHYSAPILRNTGVRAVLAYWAQLRRTACS